MKQANENRWFPNQKLPLEFSIDVRGNFVYYRGPNDPIKVSLDHALQIAEDAEVLAREIREAVEIARSMKGVTA